MNLGLLEKDLYCKQCHLRFVDKSMFEVHLSILHSDKIDHDVPKKEIITGFINWIKERIKLMSDYFCQRTTLCWTIKTCSWNPKSDREGQCLFIRVRTHSSVLFVTIIVQENSTWLSTFH